MMKLLVLMLALFAVAGLSSAEMDLDLSEAEVINTPGDVSHVKQDTFFSKFIHNEKQCGLDKTCILMHSGFILTTKRLTSYNITQ